LNTIYIIKIYLSFLFSIETLSSSYINVGVFENYESLQFSYQTTPTQVNSSSND